VGRLIELEDVPGFPERLTLAVGDVLRFAASGGHVRSGGDVVEMLGPFLPAVLGTNGEILSPMAAPNTVFFVVRRPGRAVIDVVSGDPWHAHQTTIVEISVPP
jgi:hypothetical protein